MNNGNPRKAERTPAAILLRKIPVRGNAFYFGSRLNLNALRSRLEFQ
jgi:hypothetical protein